MSFLMVIGGVFLILLAFADLMNAIVSTSTSTHHWWPSWKIGRISFIVVRWIALRLPPDSARRERMLATFAPMSLLMMLLIWTLLQVVGFAMIWNGIGMQATDSFTDSLYYSGITYFTVGFGDITPESLGLRVGAIFQSFLGVITVALVVGYLPTLYSAYTERERMLMTLDAGTSERITPTDLVIAWSPDADPKKIDEKFVEWERWATGILETHSSMPLLAYFRSHDRNQNWVTALGLLCDAALHAQIIMGATDGNAYWFLRRAEMIFHDLTHSRDLSKYEFNLEDNSEVAEAMFKDLYQRLSDHGFKLRPYDQAVAYAGEQRQYFGPAMEYLIDELVCPRGFWSLPSKTEPFSAKFKL